MKTSYLKVLALTVLAVSAIHANAVAEETAKPTVKHILVGPKGTTSVVYTPAPESETNPAKKIPIGIDNDNQQIEN